MMAYYSGAGQMAGVLDLNDMLGTNVPVTKVKFPKPPPPRALINPAVDPKGAAAQASAKAKYEAAVAEAKAKATAALPIEPDIHKDQELSVAMAFLKDTWKTAPATYIRNFDKCHARVPRQMPRDWLFWYLYNKLKMALQQPDFDTIRPMCTADCSMIGPIVKKHFRCIRKMTQMLWARPWSSNRPAVQLSWRFTRSTFLRASVTFQNRHHR
jgi:hypothetical protein